MVNDIICFENGKYERILFISPDYTFCFTIELEITKISIKRRNLEELNKLYFEGVVKPCFEDLTIQDPFDKYLSKSKIERRDKAFEIIKYMLEQQDERNLFDNHLRRKTVLEASEKFNISDVAVYKYLRLYWQGGKLKNSLVPNYHRCGGKGKDRTYTKKAGNASYEDKLLGEKAGIVIDKEIEAIFKLSIERYYKNYNERTLTKTYDLMIMNFFTDIEDGEKKVKDKTEIPTYRQFNYWYYKNRDFKGEIVKRHGSKKYQLNYRNLPSNSTYETFGPGHRYQIDATIADVYLVSRIDRKSIIGRPILYLVVDVFSRLITGIFVGLEGPCWNGAASAIYNCNEDKVEFFKKFDIEISKNQWPAQGLPQVILADRGEMVGPISEKIVEELNINIENTPSYRGDAKGIVEQKFHAMNSNIKHWSPGAIKKEFRERGERDYRLDAMLDIFEFTKIIIHSVLEKNNNPIKDYPLTKEMIRDNINPIPVEIWEWGMKNKTGRLRRLSEEQLKMSLMRRGSAVITEKGILFNKVLYNSKIENIDDWYIRARTFGREKIDIAYDNRDMTIIYMINQSDKRLIPFSVKSENQVFTNRTYEEIEDYNFNKSVKYNKLTNLINQNKVDMNVEIEKIINEAKSKNKRDASKNRITGIRENRKIESDEIKKEQSFSKIKCNEENLIELEIRYDNESECNSNYKTLDFIKNMRRKNK